ncbi:hypothetical protein [Flavobacterium sp. HJJ]|uniref:hypothetical protein n=1 Tax=Flavobacterium sp. HJJ TaxID=2783792 RepID=UPI00188B1AA1|nr:hypothetical protein [Flavobacterium sp. HJJ]MBF4471963.1 hypothetical protein [Flavobacterium sp. HJJ]
MEKISKIILINFLFLFSLSCASQNSNYLTYNEYVGIKINGISLLDIYNTRGNKKAVNALFNRNFNYESLTLPDLYKNFKDKGLYIQFLKSSIECDYELDNLMILSSNETVEIKGHKFKLGDSVIKLQKYFFKNSKSGDFIFEINPSNNIFFSTMENFFLIVIENNVITKIQYFINT